MNVVILIILAIGAVVVWKKLTKTSAPAASCVNSGVQGSNDTLNKRTAFLEDIPSDSEAERTGISFENPSCLSYINKLNGDGNHVDAVRWVNKALSLSPPFDFEIVLRRNRIVALGEMFNIGRTGARRNLNFCIATERVVRDYEAIIGLYVTNEEDLRRRNDCDFFVETFEVALDKLIPIGCLYSAYQNDDGSYGNYEGGFPGKWKIDFVSEPKNALSVNGKIYPQYKLPK